MASRKSVDGGVVLLGVVCMGIGVGIMFGSGWGWIAIGVAIVIAAFL